MNEEMTVSNLLQAVAGVSIRCFWIGFVMLLLYIGLIGLAGDWIYPVHSSFFDMTRQQFDAIHYCGMALWKSIVFGALIVYVSIRLYVKK